MNHDKKKDKLQVIYWLIENFPNAFFKKGSQIKPLKIGILDDLIDFYERLDAPPFSKKSLRDGLSYYSASPSYLRSQQQNAARVDIYGNEVDVVTAEQAQYAEQRYQSLHEKKPNRSEINELDKTPNNSTQ